MVVALRALKGDAAVASKSQFGILQRRHQCVREGGGMGIAFRVFEGDATVGSQSGCGILQRRHQCV